MQLALHVPRDTAAITTSQCSQTTALIRSISYSAPLVEFELCLQDCSKATIIYEFQNCLRLFGLDNTSTTRSVDASATSAVSPRSLFSIKRRRSLSRKQPRRKRPLSSKHNEEEEERFLQSSSSSSSPTTIVDAESACKASLPTEQAAGADFGAVCECRPHQGNKAMLSCVDTACWYCNLNATLCDEFSYGVIFDANGNEEAYWEQDQYKVGRNERLRFTESYMDSSTAANDDDDAAAMLGECSLEINGQVCQTCRFVECDDGEYYGMDFDCSNLLVGDGVVSTFNACIKDDENENQQENEETNLHFTWGIFQLYNDDYGYCYGAYDGCEWEMEELVSNGQYNCECVESEEEEVLLLTCQHSCDNPICNLGTSSMDSCIQTERIVQSYPNLLKRNQTRTVTTKNDGTIIIMEEWSCDDTRCRDCRATIGDKECNSCIMQSCRDGGDDDTIHNRAVFKPKIDCSNIQSKWNDIDLCSTDTDPTVTSIPFEYFTTLQNDSNSIFQCMTNAGLACLASKNERQSIDPHLECTCEQQQNQQQTDSTTQLTCVTNCGDVCADNICFRETLMQTFDGTGDSLQPSALSRTIQYTFGLRNTVTYEEMRGSDENGDVVSCQVTVDGIECNSCRKDICNDESSILVDCSNVDEKAVAESCDESSTNYKDGFLRRFAQNEWESCQIKSTENTLCSTAERVNLSPSEQQMGRADLFGSTMSVTGEDSDPLISCNGDSASPGVWYTLQGRGTGLEASVCDDKTDFNAQISVFAGSVCDNNDSNNKPECIGSTAHGDDCNVKWYASEESTYFLRIYGKDETSTGNFVLTVQEFDYIAESCSQHKELLEALEHKQFVCECSNDTLQCTNKCVMCNEDFTICGQEQVSIHFESATASTIRQTGSFQYLFGKNNYSSIVVEENHCTPSMDSGSCESSCHVTVDGIPCDGCQVVDCEGGGNSDFVTASKIGLEITCDNIDADFSMNTCFADAGNMDTSTNIATNLPTSLGTVPLMLNQDDLSNCLEMNGHLACMKELSTLAMAMDTIQCQCEERNDTMGDFELTCIDTSCLKCNPERRFCGFDTIQSDFLISGEPGESYNGFMVLDGTPGANATSKELGYAMASSGCSTMQDPKEICRQELQLITSEDPSSHCECQESEHSDGAYDLLCTVPPSCEYCNEDKRMCAQPLRYGQRINQYGHLTDKLYNSFLYTKGREELITVEKDGVECTVSIDGQECSRCEQIRCNEASFLPQQVEITTSLTRSTRLHSGSFLELYIDCSNVFEGLYQNVVYSCGVTMLTELDGNASVLTGSGVGSGDDQNSVFAIFEGSMELLDCRDDKETSEPIEPSTIQPSTSTIHPTIDEDDINNLFYSAATRTVTTTWVAGIFLLFLDVWRCR
ncbi:hypothetical protein IV203_004656 [Nitzschia inconspicua]|uniref:Uncharacterized protein n=1 Tax=Nitzschia inconspicua TaxID=303405 RepID=A0A9K3PPJ8_9STRA|nr:hypothetical protein IV203_004656 [Nitzschia inconspicua]